MSHPPHWDAELAAIERKAEHFAIAHKATAIMGVAVDDVAKRDYFVPRLQKMLDEHPWAAHLTFRVVPILGGGSVDLRQVRPVDRSQQTLTDGSPVTPDHREINPQTGQQKGYGVLSEAERAKGFVRPVRRTYRHLPCNTTTSMGLALAETYARDPGFYSGTFCVTCKAHFPLNQFVWEGTEEALGS